MLRTKKKQLNLKPNRVLDKRSSRGMIFENEELRLRTIHINDEVEKSQTDIKKLRKENEYLKREIWSLRDECEKLENVLQKVYSGDPPPITELPTYQPRVRKSSTISGGIWGGSRRASGVSMNFLNSSYDDENEQDQCEMQGDTENLLDDQQEDQNLLEQEQDQDMFLEDVEFEEEDLHNYDESESFVCQDQQQNVGVASEDQQKQTPHYLRTISIESNIDNIENQQQQKSTNYFNQSHHHWHLHSPELEAVTEESENTSNSNNTSIVASNESANGNGNGNDKIESTTLVTIHHPPADTDADSPMPFIDSVSVHSETPIPGSDGGCVGDSDNSYTLTPFFNPTIEITPASTSSSTTLTSTQTVKETAGGKQQTDIKCGTSPTPVPEPSSHYSTNNNKLNNECSATSTSGSNDVQDLGCVTLVPKKYQVTSELKITPNSLSNSMENILPVQTSEKRDEDESCLQVGHYSPTPTTDDDEERDKSPRLHSETAQEKRHNFTIGHHSKLYISSNPNRPARLNFVHCNHRATLTSITNNKNKNNNNSQSYYSESKFTKKKLEPLSQSEPSLSSLVIETDGEVDYDNNYLRVPDYYNSLIPQGFDGYDPSVEMCSRTLSVNSLEIGDDRGLSWNSVNKNVVIGYLDEGLDETVGVNNNNQHQPNNNNTNGVSEVRNINGDVLFRDLTVQEVIDELEAQFDPTLEKIAGVRMFTYPVPGYHPEYGRELLLEFPQRQVPKNYDSGGFYWDKYAVGVKMLIEKGFTLRGQPVKLVNDGHFNLNFKNNKKKLLIDAGKTQTSIVILTGLPSSFPDSTVISILNQFGQVTAPLERRVYKGVDISERLARMHLVKSLPTQPMTIAGYQVVAKVIGFNVDGPSTSNSCDNFDSSHHHSAMMTTIPLPPPSPKQMTSTMTRTAPGSYVNFRQNTCPSSSSSVVIPPPSTSPVLTTAAPFPSTSATPIPRPHKKVGKSASLASPQTPQTPSSPSSISAALIPSSSGTASALGPTAAAINKRKMSVCSAVMDPNCSISPNSPNQNPKSSGMTGQLQQQQQQQQKAYLGNPKKPLSRLPRSSPGSLVPQLQTQLPTTPGYIPVSQLGDPNLMSIVDSTGVKPLVRSLSFEPRRISSSGSNRGHGSEISLADSQQYQFHSQQFHQGHHGSIMTHNPATVAARQQPQPNQSRFYQPHGQLSQNNSSHSHFHSLDKNESLPWCGCWGNGCI